mmetsp:Transcript_32532/g.85464  ORF Transcript_32532/g.85464 Transcript_32532/m.85464 type:complete len:227 (-) Transcript_32532:1322-2002(-)
MRILKQETWLKVKPRWGNNGRGEYASVGAPFTSNIFSPCSHNGRSHGSTTCTTCTTSTAVMGRQMASGLNPATRGLKSTRWRRNSLSPSPVPGVWRMACSEMLATCSRACCWPTAGPLGSDLAGSWLDASLGARKAFGDLRIASGSCCCAGCDGPHASLPTCRVARALFALRPRALSEKSLSVNRHCVRSGVCLCDIVSMDIDYSHTLLCPVMLVTSATINLKIVK